MTTEKTGLTNSGLAREIDLILEHNLKNSLCAFSLQSQLMQFYLLNDFSEETVTRLLEITSKSDQQVKRMNESIERLRLLLK